MATKIFNTRTQHSRDTSANWTKYNPVLFDGEIVIVDTDAGEVRYKVGDGIKKYSQLPFSDESIKNSIPTKTSQLKNDSDYITVARAPVQSVNGKVGVVTLAASDIGAVPTSRTVNGYALSANVTVGKSDVGLGNVENVKQYSSSNPPPYPVTSVNGQTGAITVSTLKAVLQSAQPTGLSTGDFWYKIKS